jgi:hypothetical protein
LEVWPQMTVSMVADLKALKIHTVEQLADMSDSAAQQIMGNFSLRQKAKAFLDLAKQDADNTKLADELKSRDDEINLLKSQMQELLAGQQQASSAKVAPKAPAKE